MVDMGGFFSTWKPIFNIELGQECVPTTGVALCPMVTKRVSNEKVLLVHSGTTVRVIPWEIGR